MTTEKQVEAFLVKAVEEAGGTAEKFTSPSRKNVPDRIVTWRGMYGDPAEIHFIECKRPGERPTPAQRRDHVRRINMSCVVYVVDSYGAVSRYLMGTLPPETL